MAPRPLNARRGGAGLRGPLGAALVHPSGGAPGLAAAYLAAPPPLVLAEGEGEPVARCRCHHSPKLGRCLRRRCEGRGHSEGDKRPPGLWDKSTLRLSGDAADFWRITPSPTQRRQPLGGITGPASGARTAAVVRAALARPGPLSAAAAREPARPLAVFGGGSASGRDILITENVL